MYIPGKAQGNCKPDFSISPSLADNDLIGEEVPVELKEDLDWEKWKGLYEEKKPEDEGTK